MTSRPTFTIVVPTLGRRPPLLEQAVRSVLAQTMGDLEVIIVVDGSGDVPPVVLDPRVRVIQRRVNGGAPAARNSGIEAARGKWIGFLDDDDLLEPHRLETVTGYLEDAPVVVCWMARLGDRSRSPMDARELHGDVSAEILEAPVPHVGTTLVRADRVPPFDERFRLSDDVEWWFRLASVASVRTVPEVGYLYREHDGQRLTNQIAVRLAARLQMIELHQDRLRHYPRSASYQWRRAGGFALAMGDRRQARRYFLRALRARPGIRDLAHLTRAMLPR